MFLRRHMHSFPPLKLLHTDFAVGLQYLADSIRKREEEPEILGVQGRRATETKESRISEESHALLLSSVVAPTTPLLASIGKASICQNYSLDEPTALFTLAI
jgi:hypothetical protein